MNIITQAIYDMYFIKHDIEHRYWDVWPRGYVLVSDVTQAEMFAVIISQGKNAGIRLKGDAGVLKAFKIADASVEVAGVNDSCYYQRGSGPILIRLYGFKFFSQAIQPLAPGDPMGFLETPPDIPPSGEVFDQILPDDEDFDHDWDFEDED